MSVTRYLTHTVLFQEIPDEISLTFYITECPFHCDGCHSPILQSKSGIPLTIKEIDLYIERYAQIISCVCFMGDGSNPKEITEYAKHIKDKYQIKTAIYSGYEESVALTYYKQFFDYVKCGPYKKKLGGLDCETTNQRFYRIHSDLSVEDITSKFWKKKTLQCP